jgi:lipoyl(octanoyl) transferase
LYSRTQSEKKPLRTVWLGRADYAETLALQRALVRAVSDGTGLETLLLLEHPHVYTLGRRGKHEDILVGTAELTALDVEVHETDRGGEVTYHGPGQLVGYPIVDLRPLGGPLKFVCALQEAVVTALSAYGVPASCADRPTGIWVGDAKIGAIGLRVSRGISSHGFAVNINPDLSYFDRIVPCGMPGVDVTSVLREGLGEGSGATVRDAASLVADALGSALGRPVVWAEPADLPKPAA